MTKIGLIGPAHSTENIDYVKEWQNFVHKKDKVITFWSYKLRPNIKCQLEKQIKSDGYFPLYFYITNNPINPNEIKGKVAYIGLVNEFEYGDYISSPDVNYTAKVDKGKKGHGWYTIKEIQSINKISEDFERFDKPNEILTRLSFSAMRHPRSPFIVVKKLN